jgi:hypothetical protein
LLKGAYRSIIFSVLSTFPIELSNVFLRPCSLALLKEIIFAMPSGWYHTLQYPGSSPTISVIAIPALQWISILLLLVIQMFCSSLLLWNTSIVDLLSSSSYHHDLGIGTQLHHVFPLRFLASRAALIFVVPPVLSPPCIQLHNANIVVLVIDNCCKGHALLITMIFHQCSYMTHRHQHSNGSKCVSRIIFPICQHSCSSTSV